MSAVVIPAPFPIHGYTMPDNGTLNNLLASPQVSSQDGITATASGTQLTGFPITARVNRVSTVAKSS